VEVYENINTILKEKNITKRWFAKRLRELEPKLHSTGEIPTEKTVYGYLNGTSQLKIELIPFICEVLRVNESELFNYKQKLKIKSPQVKYNSSQNDLEKLTELLPYAPKPMVQKLIKELENIKKFNDSI